MNDEGALVRALFELLPHLGRIAAKSAREAGSLSVDRLKTLGILEHLAPIRAGELAEGCHLSPAAVTHTVDALVEDGLVRREPDTADRRAVILHVTPKGRRERAHAQQVALTGLARALEGLDPRTRAQLREALPKLQRVLAQREDEEQKVSLVR